MKKISFLLSSALIWSLAATAKNIGDPDTVAFKFGNKSYQIPPLSLNWQQAKVDCISRGMALASVETKEENDAIVAIAGAGEFWISLNDIAFEGQYYWESTSQLLGGYSNWMNGQPNNNGNQDCVRYETNLWNDCPCDFTLRYICESL